MWTYFYPHFIFHLTRWFPKNNRVKFRILAFIVSVALLIPEFYVLLTPKSVRACGQPLLPILVTTTCFIFFTVGFAFLFSLLDPIQRLTTLVFHAFGILSFILGLLTTVFTLQATGCAETTPELYYWCYTSMILSLICMGYFVIMAPFWIMEACRPRSLIDVKAREGFCYEPVMCCSCWWHVV